MSIRRPINIRTERKVLKFLYLKDFLFIGFYMGFAMMLGSTVYGDVRVAYYIFSFLMSAFLTAPSIVNPNRRNWQSFILAYHKWQDQKVYKPVPNVSYRRQDEE